MPVFICQGCGSEHSSWGGKCPHCGVSETIQLKQSADRMLEKVIKGKYKIVRKLGQGGMGAVYLAEQLGIGHKVALKFLKSEFSEEPEVARRFLNEAKSYARVAHPNAVTLHDFGQDEEGNLFIAMEYCEGIDLKKILQQQKRIPLGEAIDIILQIADVLGHAHSKQVVHRDLKPENIMLRKGMRGIHVKVLDFGIARLMNEGTKLTMQGAIAGTPRYMAPEQVEGRDDVDHRADVYAVGILLYEMLTGVQPFDGATITEILRNQVVQPMPRLSYVAAELDYPDVEAVLQKACAKNRTERFQDMTAFAQQLAQAMPTQAGKPGTGVWAGMPSSNQAEPPAGLGPEVATMQATFVRSGTQIQHPFSAPLATPVGGLPPTALSPKHVPPAGGLPPTALSPKHLPAAAAVAAAAAAQTLPPDELALKVPRSRGPVIALGVVGLLVVAGGGALLLNRHSDPAVKDPPVVVKDPPVVAKDPPVVTKDPPAVAKDPPVVARLPDETANNFGRDQLARGTTSFAVGNLDECEIYLHAVPAETGSRPEADGLQKKIDDIREKVKRGQGAVAAGNCDAASVLFTEVLRINPRIQPAKEGLQRCRNAAIPTTLDP